MLRAAIDRGAEKLRAIVRSLLTWSIVDRSLLAIAFSLGGILLFVGSLHVIGGWPYLPPSIDPAVFAVAVTMAHASLVPWLALLLIGLALRRRWPGATLFMHATVQFYAATLALLTYGTGISFAFGWLAFEGCAIVGLLLFGRRALTGVVTYLVLVLALGVGAERGWVIDVPRVLADALARPATPLWWGSLRLTVYAVVVCGVVLAIFLYQMRLLEEERARSERLLLNMLPAAIAERLKCEPGAIADGFDGVTVLFADIVGFTPMSERMSPGEVVGLLNEVFSAFDDMARRLKLEKIKTIGDAYMVVGGLPCPRADHAVAIAEMAIEMNAAAARLAGGGIAMRIGMHSGPVIAGVIGTAKYSYDLWGDTVNIASRMESHGSPGRIHVTEAVRAALGEGWELEERGVVEIKGKGPMRTFWLTGRRAPGARSP